MHYVAICLDKPNSQDLRLKNRTAHLDYLRANAKTIKSCGPFLSEDGKDMVGSLLIIEAKDRAGVDGVLAQDPYRKAGLFGSVEVRGWRWVVGCPIN
ncbi:MAG TPA: YciI family protein [Xanthobacteraceae bacterium]|nr:YciI family protein [Xanthobacteraceae bacterium]